MHECTSNRSGSLSTRLVNLGRPSWPLLSLGRVISKDNYVLTTRFDLVEVCGRSVVTLSMRVKDSVLWLVAIGLRATIDLPCGRTVILRRCRDSIYSYKVRIRWPKSVGEELRFLVKDDIVVSKKMSSQATRRTGEQFEHHRAHNSRPCSLVSISASYSDSKWFGSSLFMEEHDREGLSETGHFSYVRPFGFLCVAPWFNDLEAALATVSMWLAIYARGGSSQLP